MGLKVLGFAYNRAFTFEVPVYKGGGAGGRSIHKTAHRHTEHPGLEGSVVDYLGKLRNVIWVA